MAGSVHEDDVHIDRTHGAAVRDEIGERLSAALIARSVALPARLLELIQELAKDRTSESALRRSRGLKP
jgi:hypothetical protein